VFRSRGATLKQRFCSDADMSVLGQTLQRILVMSALPPKADIGTQSWNVRFVPIADIARPFGCVGNYSPQQPPESLHLLNEVSLSFKIADEAPSNCSY
jgi:hypothetical protein